MTFLNTRYKLLRELMPAELRRLSNVATVYGIRGLSFEGHELVVEYDASRIHEAEVLNTIRSAAIPVAAEKPIPLGSFDYRGEVRDFAWPTTGLSPVNSK
ncbi:MAG TPA: hypothetical protein VKM93_27790 [Terriglobia bacterium]|nr:hypothetical protein [Terriglobia bacterium]